MTLRDLSTAGFVDVGDTRVEHRRSRALAFVFDSSFLRAFKVLVYSLVATRSVLDLPVIVFTQDQRVHDDPVVAAVTDRRVLITPNDYAQFATVSREHIRRDKQLSWIAKYTFLKWLIFDDHGVDDLLFVDADIVALAPCDPIFDDAAGTDIAVAPVFPSTLYTRDGAPLSPEAVAGNFQALIDAKFPAGPPRINSGVIVLSGDCLTPAFRRKLLGLTQVHSFVNEQRYISTILAEDPGIRWRMLSSKYNFNAGMLNHTRLHDQLSLLSQTVFLHYPGKIKPWARPVRNASGFAQMIWRRYETDALERSDLLGGGNRVRRFLRDWG